MNRYTTAKQSSDMAWNSVASQLGVPRSSARKKLAEILKPLIESARKGANINLQHGTLTRKAVHGRKHFDGLEEYSGPKYRIVFRDRRIQRPYK